MDRDDPIWITGIGSATPLGCGLAEIESNLTGWSVGRGGGDVFSDRGLSEPHCRPGRENPRSSQLYGRGLRGEEPARPAYSSGASRSALRDAGLWETRREARVGLVLGLGAELMYHWETDHFRGGTRIYDPEQDAESTIDRLRRELELSGPVLALSAACASGNHALEMGRTWLRLGLVDVCVAGACDLAVTPIGLATFGNLRALSRRNSDPAGASRPFDRARDGFVLGEGGVAFVLERAASARSTLGRCLRRGRRLRLEQRCAPPRHSEPRSRVRRRRRAPGPGRCAPRSRRVSTMSMPMRRERRSVTLPRRTSLRIVLGDDAARIPVSSTKSLTGHMLTAAGAFEALACLTAMRHQAIPPTINLDEPDVDLCLVANEARPHKVRVALSNSFGFGGSNTSLVLRGVGRKSGNPGL